MTASPLTVLVAAGTLLLALLAGFGVSLAGFQGDARSDVEQRFAERAQLSAAFTQALFASSSSAAQEANANRFGAARVRREIVSAWAPRQHYSNVAVLDDRGAILASSANTPRSVTRVLRTRPDYVRRALAGQAFVPSDVLRPGGGPPVIQAAQPFRTPHGRRVLVSGVRPQLLHALLGRYLSQVPNPGGRAYVLDGNGVVVAGSARRTRTGQAVDEPGLITALGRDPEGTYGESHYAASSLEGTTWRVVLTVPTSRLFASVEGARTWLPWTIFAAFAAAAGLALLLLWRGLRGAAKLRQSQERYALAVRGANDGIWDHDLVTDRLYLSSRWKEILGLAAEPTSSDGWWSRVHPDDLDHLHAAVQAHLAGDGRTLEHEHRILHGDGTYRWTLVRGVAIRDRHGRPTRMAGSMSDITARKLAEERLRRDALYDALTGLANRNLFLQRLTESLAARQDPDRRCAVLFLDLDRFKLINDSFSHTVGDELLVELGRRLTAVLRPEDTVSRGGAEHMVARLGGDEFTILLDGVGPEVPLEIAQRIMRALEQPFHVDDRRVFVSGSIGIVLSNRGSTPAEMMRNADLAMYEAKRGGESRALLYSEDMHARATARLEVEIALRSAIDERRLRVFYQPIVDLGTGRLSGFEALARWPQDLPAVTPDQFIPVAEETGLINPLGRLVLETACAQLSSWREDGLVDPAVTMSVNVAGCQLSDPDRLIGDVTAAMAQSGLPPEVLRLEITEGTIISEPERVRATLDELARLGVHAHIDDFGTGYSSLTFLQYFAGDTLKIDRSFISAMHEQQADFEIVRAMISMAHNLGLSTVAEGIEDPVQVAQLRTLGCEYGQGFLFAKPLAAEHVAALVSAWDSDAIVRLGAAPPADAIAL
ncbi:MAG: EAL domain-containing protein [Solirubrobacterales bacterium]|nr:EAL domain-containing protein [Solirubrobacterales bacterium]